MFRKKKTDGRKKKRSEMKTRKEATEYSEEQREIACEGHGAVSTRILQEIYS